MALLSLRVLLFINLSPACSYLNDKKTNFFISFVMTLAFIYPVYSSKDLSWMCENRKNPDMSGLR